MSSETLIVDTIKPDPVATVTATVKDRRQTSFHLAWTAPADCGSAAVLVHREGLEERDHRRELRRGDDDLPIPGRRRRPTRPTASTPPACSSRTTTTSRSRRSTRPETAARSRPSGPSMAHFNMKILTPPAGGPTNERFGWSIDGVADLNGDGKSDILVGTLSGQRVYIFNGSATFNTVTAPTTIITGQAGGRLRPPVHRRRRHRCRRQGRLRDLGAVARQRQHLHLQGPRRVERDLHRRFRRRLHSRPRSDLRGDAARWLDGAAGRLQRRRGRRLRRRRIRLQRRPWSRRRDPRTRGILGGDSEPA